MGARFRLRGDFNVAGYRPDTQVVLRAMQHYGLILADNGSNWFFQGTAENGWDPGLIQDLKRIPASGFEAVDESSLMVDPNSGQARGAGPAPAPAPVGTTAPRPAPRRPAPAPAATVRTATTEPPTTTTSAPAPTTTAATPTTTGTPGTAVALGGRGRPNGRGSWVPALATGLLATAGAAFATALRLRRPRAS
jgi:hypothetical protein